MLRICTEKQCKKRIRFPYHGDDGIEEICNNCKRMYKVSPPSRKRVNIFWFILGLIGIASTVVGYQFYNNQGEKTPSNPKISESIEGEYICSTCLAKDCIGKKIVIYNLASPNQNSEASFKWDTPTIGSKGINLEGKFYSQNNKNFALLLYGEQDTFGIFEFFLDNSDEIQKLTHQNMTQCTFEKQ